MLILFTICQPELVAHLLHGRIPAAEMDSGGPGATQIAPGERAVGTYLVREGRPVWVDGLLCLLIGVTRPREAWDRSRSQSGQENVGYL